MDIEKFREDWWGGPSLKGEEWIQKSYQEPLSFWQSLLSLQTKTSSIPSKSLLGETYDFYHDCILRHPEANQALLYIDEEGFLQSWSYKKIHRAVNFQVKQWSKNGVKPGQVAVLILPPGVRFFITLLTALRLGLTICYLPYETPYLSNEHLSSVVDQIKPAWIVTHQKASLPSLTHYPKILIDDLEEDGQAHEPLSYLYEAQQTIQLSLSLHRQIPFSVVPLTAETTYLHALRDGLITLNLQPNQTLAAPLACPIRTEPCTTLMTLLSGSTLLHIEEKALKNDPSILKSEKIHLLGVSPPLQKLLSDHPTPLGKSLRGYYKSPLSPNRSTWKTFVKLNKLEETPCFNLLIDNSFGGSLFFSKPSLEDPNIFFKPSLGLSWQLKNLSGNGETSMTGFGYFSPSLSIKENDHLPSNFIVAQIENNLVISTTAKPCKEGITLPIENIERLISKLPFVQHCLLHTILKMGEVVSHQTFLLVFIHPLQNNVPEHTKHTWVESIHSLIIENIGSAFIPDHIEFYPLVPPLRKGEVDKGWCIDQFNNGNLNKKRSSQVHQLISTLKQLAQEASETKT